MKAEILNKLTKLLNEESCFSKESDVVYFMVESRKLLDHAIEETGQGLFPILRFYCDWTLHTDKKKITPDIKNVMDIIDHNVLQDKTSWQSQLKQKENVSFANLDYLKVDLTKFLKQFSLPETLTNDEKIWQSFVLKLTKVLIDQPIIKPNVNINKFYFEPSSEHAIVWVIEFNDQRGACKFGNALF